MSTVKSGLPIFYLVLRRVPGRPRLLHQVRRGKARTRAGARAGGGAGRVGAPGAAAALTGAPFSPRSDQLRYTTWLHPRTGEPVNSGHMIRSGGRRKGGVERLGGRGACAWVAPSLIGLFSCSRRPAPWLGGGLHGGGRQLLHRVSVGGAGPVPVP